MRYQSEQEAVKAMLEGIVFGNEDLYRDAAKQVWRARSTLDAFFETVNCLVNSSYEQIFEEWAIGVRTGMDKFNRAAELYHNRLFAFLAAYAPPEVRVVFTVCPDRVFMHDHPYLEHELEYALKLQTSGQTGATGIAGKMVTGGLDGD